MNQNIPTFVGQISSQSCEIQSLFLVAITRRANKNGEHRMCRQFLICSLRSHSDKKYEYFYFIRHNIPKLTLIFYCLKEPGKRCGAQVTRTLFLPRSRLLLFSLT
jgi:hypothetical protein